MHQRKADNNRLKVSGLGFRISYDEEPLPDKPEIIALILSTGRPGMVPSIQPRWIE